MGNTLVQVSGLGDVAIKSYDENTALALAVRPNLTGESVCNANVFNRFACQPLQYTRNTPASRTQSTPLPVHCPLQLLPARCTRIAHNHRSTRHTPAPLRTTQPTRSGAFGSTNAGTPTRRRSTRSPTAALKHDANEASPTPTQPRTTQTPTDRPAQEFEL
jgi:hypothetical protein